MWTSAIADTSLIYWHFGGLLQRFLQRFLFRPVLTRCRLGEMLVGHLKVVLGRDSLRLVYPRTNNVQRVFFCQFRFTRATKVLEQLGPWF